MYKINTLSAPFGVSEGLLPGEQCSLAGHSLWVLRSLAGSGMALVDNPSHLPGELRSPLVYDTQCSTMLFCEE